MAASARFPRTARLLRPAEFTAVFATARRLQTPAFRLHAQLAPSAGDAAGSCQTAARLGIAVPKRVAVRAVERNRIRRIVREDFRLRRARLPAGDYVLVAQRDANLAPAAALRAALAELWRRAGVLNPPPAAPTMHGSAPPPAKRDDAPVRARRAADERQAGPPRPAPARKTRRTIADP